MDNSSSGANNESKQHNSQEQSSYSEASENISEIEKLYLKIKEDWL